MAKWFITDDGQAVNLDMATQIIIRGDLSVVALFACPNEAIGMEEGVDAFILKICSNKDQAKEFIREIILYENSH